jgi:hypothetical protein
MEYVAFELHGEMAKSLVGVMSLSIMTDKAELWMRQCRAGRRYLCE